MKRVSKVLLFIVCILCSIQCAFHHADKDTFIKLSLQCRDSESNKIVVTDEYVNVGKTAIIVVDMWDNHHCISAAQRVVEMAPTMNEVLKNARQIGIFIIHAPSDCMDFYKNTPQRRRAQNSPFIKVPIKFKWNYFDPEREEDLNSIIESGCSCNTLEPCGPGYRAWERQIEIIEIEAEDAISDSGQEIYNMLEQRGIDTVIFMGVHTNVCVLSRSFGIRQMVYLDKNVILCRDLTDSYTRTPGKHFGSLVKVIAYIERYWCPTIQSDQLTGNKPFHFKDDDSFEI